MYVFSLNEPVISDGEQTPTENKTGGEEERSFKNEEERKENPKAKDKRKKKTKTKWGKNEKKSKK